MTKKVRSNYEDALAVLNGTMLTSKDRRTTDAPAIEYRRYRTPNSQVLAPTYGISNKMLNVLSALANKVTFVSGMPRFHFSL